MNKGILKKVAAYAGIVLLFLVIAYAFVPQVLDKSKILGQSDISAFQGMAHEVLEYNNAHPDDKSAWTDSMFGGMPTVAMTDITSGDMTKPLYKLLFFGRRPASYLFVAMLGAFLLLLASGIDKWLAAGGAIAMAFCSYNMQIIQVGHNTKMQAIALFPWVLAALIFTYRSALGKYHKTAGDGKKAALTREWLPQTIVSAVLFALAVSFQIKANHPQITYYLAICVLMYALVLFIWLISKPERRALIGRFFIASALLLTIGGVGIATNINRLVPTMQYSKYTMRGGSELSATSDSHNDKGLDLDYATAWSYGWEELPNLMIPDFNGGASTGPLKEDSATGKLLKQAGYRGRELKDTLKYMPLYWGPQPFTAGPMYMGAICIFLFILGLLLDDGKEKWWLLAVSVLAVLLALGNHLMSFTRFMFKYAPMYDKFRTVSMSLVILQVSVPLLGFAVLDGILKKKYDYALMRKYTFIAWGVTGGICLLLSLFPGMAGSFESAGDARIQDVLREALTADRRALLSHDALRSFLFITAAAAVLLWAGRRDRTSSDRKSAASAIICLLVLVDLFAVGKRYLNADHFMTKKAFNSAYDLRPVDNAILQDNSLYRVLDLSEDTFNSSRTSYHHKSIGGYSPVKMQRYQDLIDRYLRKELNSIIGTVNQYKTLSGVAENFPETPVLSMLNGKYVILDEGMAPVVNPDAFGEAWFVEDCVNAANPDEEIALLGKVDLRKCAVVGEDFSSFRDRIKAVSGPQEGDSIAYKTYTPKEIRYSYNASGERAVVFSEIFYPEGWKLTFLPSDGTAAQELDVFRADWTLRAAIVPAGSGELVLRFEPKNVNVCNKLSKAASATLIAFLLIAAVIILVSGKKRDDNQETN